MGMVVIRCLECKNRSIIEENGSNLVCDICGSKDVINEGGIEEFLPSEEVIREAMNFKI